MLPVHTYNTFTPPSSPLTSPLNIEKDDLTLQFNHSIPTHSCSCSSSSVIMNAHENLDPLSLTKKKKRKWISEKQIITTNHGSASASSHSDSNKDKNLNPLIQASLPLPIPTTPSSSCSLTSTSSSTSSPTTSLSVLPSPLPTPPSSHFVFCSPPTHHLKCSSYDTTTPSTTSLLNQPQQPFSTEACSSSSSSSSFSSSTSLAPAFNDLFDNQPTPIPLILSNPFYIACSSPPTETLFTKKTDFNHNVVNPLYLSTPLYNMNFNQEQVKDQLVNCLQSIQSNPFLNVLRSETTTLLDPFDSNSFLSIPHLGSIGSLEANSVMRYLEPLYIEFFSQCKYQFHSTLSSSSSPSPCSYIQLYSNQLQQLGEFILTRLSKDYLPSQNLSHIFVQLDFQLNPSFISTCSSSSSSSSSFFKSKDEDFIPSYELYPIRIHSQVTVLPLLLSPSISSTTSLSYSNETIHTTKQQHQHIGLIFTLLPFTSSLAMGPSFPSHFYPTAQPMCLHSSTSFSILNSLNKNDNGTDPILYFYFTQEKERPISYSE